MAATKNKKNDASSGTDSLFDALHPGKMVSNAQRVLNAAVDVLEGEIAAGILAAKKMESKIFDVDDIREDPQDLMNRIRRDVHDAVDLLMDSLTAITRQLGDLTPGGDIKRKAPTEQPQAAASMPIISNIKPVTAGQIVVLKLSVTNTEKDVSETVQFHQTGLTGPQATQIPAKNIAIRPAKVSLKPGEQKEFSIRVSIPKNSTAGSYSGLLVDIHNPSSKAIIQIDVA